MQMSKQSSGRNHSCFSGKTAVFRVVMLLLLLAIWGLTQLLSGLNFKASITVAEEGGILAMARMGKKDPAVAPAVEEEGAATAREEKKDPLIVYFSQGPAKAYPSLKKRVDKFSPEGTAVFFYHSYDEDCDGCIFKKGTTFAEGWNLVAKTALLSPFADQMKYFVRFDDDIKLLSTGLGKANTGHGAWEDFHQMLLSPDTNYPLIRPQDKARAEEKYTVYESCVDQHFYAIRKDHISLIFPYSTYAKECIWLNDEMLFYVMEKCYPAGFLVDHRWTVANDDHRYATDNRVEYSEKYVRDKALGALNEAYPSLGLWVRRNHSKLKHRCTVKEVPSFGLNGECRKVFQDRFERWLEGS